MPHPDLTAMVIAIIAKEYKNITERLNNNDFFMIFLRKIVLLCAKKLLPLPSFKKTKMKTTLTDIAEKTGYSIATVSRVLNGKSGQYRISNEAYNSIMEEAKKSGYIGKMNAQSLRKSKTRSIGVIVPSIANPFFAEISDTIIKEAARHGYTAIMAVTMESPTEQEACLSAILSKNVEGIIAAPCGNESFLFENINKEIIPVVLVDRFFADSNISYITSNNYKGAVDGTNMLINNGHRHIACIQGDTNSIPNKKRVEGYMTAMRNASLQDCAMVVGDSFSFQNGYLETRLLLSDSSYRPSAIFSLSYNISLGVIKALRENGLKIGEDISIITFDDNMCLDYMEPPITRVRQPIEELGKFATKVLFEHIGNPNAKTTQLELTTRIILGNSVCPYSK